MCQFKSTPSSQNYLIQTAEFVLGFPSRRWP